MLVRLVFLKLLNGLVLDDDELENGLLEGIDDWLENGLFFDFWLFIYEERY